MAGNIGPIILGLGAAFLFLRKKDGGTATTPEDTGFGGHAGGDSPCHLLTGVWAQSAPAATSALSEITTSQNLAILPLTPDAFKAIDLSIQGYLNGLAEGEEANEVDAVMMAQVQVTQGLGCPWGKPEEWTTRMRHVHDAIVVMYNHPGLYQHS